MNELRMAPSTVWRNSVRGIRNAWTFTPPAFSARLVFSTFLSSMVTSARSMSDFAQTVSCDRLPQRMAARIERSCFTCFTRSSSASVNFFWTDPVEALKIFEPIALILERQGVPSSFAHSELAQARNSGIGTPRRCSHSQ